MDSVWIVYELFTDGSMDLKKTFSTEKKATDYIDEQKRKELYYEEMEVE